MRCFRWRITNYQGQYVFGGSQTGTAPFSLNSSTSPATVTYNGDSQVNTLVSPNGQTIQLNVPGRPDIYQLCGQCYRSTQ